MTFHKHGGAQRHQCNLGCPHSLRCNLGCPHSGAVLGCPYSGAVLGCPHLLAQVQSYNVLPLQCGS